MPDVTGKLPEPPRIAEPTPPAPIPEIDYSGLRSREWDPAIAVKKVGWAVAKISAAKLSTPAAIAAFLHFTDYLKPYGITVIVDEAILSNALPLFIFAAMVSAHDAAKIKLGYKWL